jgi:DNA-directed RNA polymerase specialized sigma24 family protein
MIAAIYDMGVEVAEKPSSRILSHMDPETKIVHCRLEAWGKWSRDCHIPAWPEATLLARVIEEGPHGAFSSGKPPIHMPDSVAHVDAAVCRLGEVDRRVIRKYYLEWAPTEALARAVRMNVRQFKAVLHRARWRVAGYLSAIEAIEG